jgi:lipopolysaccharide-induced tumor necrosis factor-alpha factor
MEIASGSILGQGNDMTKPALGGGEPGSGLNGQLLSRLAHGAEGRITCPRCQHTGDANVKYEIGGATHAACFLTCFLGGVLCCCLAPYFLDDCKDAEVHCSSCGTLVSRRYLL